MERTENLEGIVSRGFSSVKDRVFSSVSNGYARVKDVFSETTNSFLPTRLLFLYMAYFFMSNVTLVVAQNSENKIAFESERDGNHEIYVVDADGLNLRNLSNNPGLDQDPAWSPDNSKIAYASSQRNFFSFKRDYEIYVVNPDGSNQTRLTNTNLHFISPAWSPDGNKIAFTSAEGWIIDWLGETYIMDTDGSNITSPSNNPAEIDANPAWSPDGNKIAFMSKRDENYEIYVMDADGSNQTNLTNHPGRDTDFSWSPDGSKIVFSSYREGNSEIYLINPDGSNQTRLTNNTDSGAPCWSPDGKYIAFVHKRDIHVIGVDGSNLTNLTNNPDDLNTEPAWSPDGKKIAFMSRRDENFEIYTMNPDGSNQKNVSNNPGVDGMPVWSNKVK